MKPQPSAVKDFTSLYIDFDAFFAHVEKQAESGLRDLPVGITALGSESSMLITCCYVAKRAGVTRGMRARDARKICPNIAIRVARPDVYVDFHNRIVAEVNRHIPVKKVWSIDEVECALIGRECKNALVLAANIREGLRINIGAYVTPSIGLAPNQFLAKVAAEMEKPNGFVALRGADLPDAILHLNLKDLPGISGNMQARLNRAGVQSLKQFWDISPKHARAIWGNVEGERMWRELRGQTVERPTTTRRMFGHSRVLSGAWQSPDKAIDCLRLLTVKAANRLRREEYSAGTLSLSFRIQEPRTGQERWKGHVSFAPCRNDRDFLQHLHSLYQRGLSEARPTRLRSVSVMLHDIAKTAQRPMDLFESEDTQRWDKLTDLMDGFNKAHGRALIHLGPRANLPGGYAGAKIAFGRIPSKEDFL